MSPADAGRLEKIRASLDPADAEWLAAQLEPKWMQRERRLSHRDGMARLASLVLCEGLPPKTAARHLATHLGRYLAGPTWRRQQHAETLPFETPIAQVFLHRIARFNGGKAIGERQLFSILTGSRSN